MQEPEFYLQKLTNEIVKHFNEQKPGFCTSALEIIKEIQKETEESITISKKEYEGLIEDSNMLTALNSAGVDNWEGYDAAIEMYNEIKG